MMKPVVMLELNEVNFDFVQRYCAKGLLPNLGRLIAERGITRTTSEQRYEELEPWIQWVTAHTGKTLAEHGVFRLGDITQHRHLQIWEFLESHGIKVGAISPMNAANALRNPAFFVPDPWTRTEVAGGWLTQEFYRAIAQAVSDNADGRVGARSAVGLMLGWLLHFRAATAPAQLKLAIQRRHVPGAAALFLDRLLADVFMVQWRRRRPAFATLFLNAAAHIQHHYMYGSAVYDGPHRNPDWYLPTGVDPVLRVYELYDRVVADMRQLPDAPRLLIATGLHQDPYPQPVYYWRLRDHAAFLRRAGIDPVAVVPLMSRDFRVECGSEESARAAQSRLEAMQGPDTTRVFDVDNRGASLFVTLSYPGPIEKPFPVNGGNGPVELADEVAFVALKNGGHNGIGYLIDSGLEVGTSERPATMPLTDLFGYVCRLFAVPAAPALRG